MKLGNIDVIDLKLGEDRIQKVMLGNNEVWLFMNDELYFYFWGSQVSTPAGIKKYLKSDLSFVGETPTIGLSNIMIDIDDKHLYATSISTQTVRKYLKADMSYIGEVAVETRNRINVDETYIYASGTTTTGIIRKYLKSNLSYVTESIDYDGYSPEAMTIDDTYVYLALFKETVAHRFLKSDLSYVGQSGAYGDTIRGITTDETHVYLCGGLQRVRKYLKSNFSYVSQTALYGSTLFAITLDDTHIYTGGDTPRRVNKYLKTDMSYVSQTVANGGLIRDIKVDDDYIFVAGDASKVKKHSKSEMTFIDATENFGGVTFSIALGIK